MCSLATNISVNKSRAVRRIIEQPPSANCKSTRQIDCRAGVLLARSNHQAAQLHGTLASVTFHTWSRARICSEASLRQGMQSLTAAIIEHVSV